MLPTILPSTALTGSRIVAPLACLTFAFTVAAVACGRAGGEIGSELPWALGLASLLLTSSAWDIASYRLPDRLTLAVALLGAAYACKSGGTEALAFAALGGTVGFALLYFVRAIYLNLRGRAGLGLGDVKLLGAAGLWVGVTGLPVVVLVASASALAVVAAGLVIGKHYDRDSRIPFGPFLAFGLWVSWLARDLT